VLNAELNFIALFGNELEIIELIVKRDETVIFFNHHDPLSKVSTVLDQIISKGHKISKIKDNATYFKDCQGILLNDLRETLKKTNLNRKFNKFVWNIIHIQNYWIF
jgi:hypothetical protein